MTTLHELAKEYREVAAMADSDDEGMAVAVLDTLEAIGGTFEEKAKAVVSVALNRESDVAAIDAEIDRLKARKAAINNQASRLYEYLRENMEATGIKKISCPLFSITLAEGMELACIDDESKLPDELMRVKTEIAPDKVAILKRLKEGVEVPGAHIERSQSSIRIK